MFGLLLYISIGIWYIEIGQDGIQSNVNVSCWVRRVDASGIYSKSRSHPTLVTSPCPSCRPCLPGTICQECFFSVSTWDNKYGRTTGAAWRKALFNQGRNITNKISHQRNQHLRRQRGITAYVGSDRKCKTQLINTIKDLQ